MWGDTHAGILSSCTSSPYSPLLSKNICQSTDFTIICFQHIDFPRDLSQLIFFFLSYLFNGDAKLAAKLDTFKLLSYVKLSTLYCVIYANSIDSSFPKQS